MLQTLRQDWDAIAVEAWRKMAAARASIEEKRGLTSDKEVGSDDEDTEAGRTITGDVTDANSIYGHSASGANGQASVKARP